MTLDFFMGLWKKYFIISCLFWFCNILSAAGGEIRYLNGLADIERKGQKITAATGSPIMPGDKLTLAESANMVINLERSGLLKLSGPASLEIPPVAGSRISTVRLFLGSLWTEIKEMVAGESFKVLTPTATCGVRGTIFEVNYDPQTNITTALVEQGSIYARNTMGDEQILQRGMIGELLKDKINTRRDLLLLAQRRLHFSGIPHSNSSSDLKAAEKSRQQAQEQLENAQKWRNRMDELQQKINPQATDTPAKSEDWQGKKQSENHKPNENNRTNRDNNKKYRPDQNMFLLNQLKKSSRYKSTEQNRSKLPFREQRKRTDRLRIFQLRAREAKTRPKTYTIQEFEAKSRHKDRAEPINQPADNHQKEPIHHTEPTIPNHHTEPTIPNHDPATP